MKKVFLIFSILISVINAQINRETRAVWVSTNFRLDWPPPTTNQEEQKTALIKIFDEIERKNLNTIYFQVRFNGTVLFNSSFEPYSYFITGSVGGSPDYDPLEFAIEEAHKRGLELHAWFNMIRCFSGTEKFILDHDDHVVKKYPAWVKKVFVDGKINYWLDPGLPEVKEYLANLVVEAAQNYKVDGIHLDFIRYPVERFDDDSSYALFGAQKDKAQWRRDNITEIVKVTGERIRQIDERIKFGAAPLGIYRNIAGAKGLQAVDEVYQDSRLWLKEKYIDYAAPQIYWNSTDNPRFDLLIDDWVKNSYGRNIIAGIASYKDDVRNETENLIALARKSNSNGVAFFRYTNIKDKEIKQFASKSFPAEMHWKIKRQPPSPFNLASEISDAGENKIKLSWQFNCDELNSEDVSYFAVFGLSRQNEIPSSKNLFKIIDAQRTSFSFTIKQPQRINYYFTVKSLSRLWEESGGYSNIEKVGMPQLKSLSDKTGIDDNVIMRRLDADSYRFVVSSGLERTAEILFVGKNSLTQTETKKLAAGINIFQIKKESVVFDEIEIRVGGGKKFRLRK